MQIIKHGTNIDFIGKRKPALFISTMLNLAILVGIAIFGFNFGVDFVGGTVVEMRFDHEISAADVRKRVEAGGLKDVSVQGIGSSSEHSFLVRLGGMTQLTKESADKAKVALAPLGNLTSYYADVDNGILRLRYEAKVAPSVIKDAITASGTGVKEVRDMGAAQGGGVDYQVVASGMADKVVTTLGSGGASDFKVQRVDYVGPQVGKQLRNKGVMALLYAMFAILVYVAFRFDFKFGPGALVAMVHDVIMVSGYFLVSRREFNLTSIAVLLTITGYSINDTIVVYDRIREEMARFRGKPLPEIINIAVNDTLSRTILTSGVTALSLVGLLIFGVGEIWDFAMAMFIGIVVGTYSSVYIASPLTIWLDEREARKSRAMKMSTAA
jgi:preprotein translocase subunit SecF